MIAPPFRRKAFARVFPFTGLGLLLPALVPSWRFFDGVSASPRIDYAMADEKPPEWRELRPRVAVLGPWSMVLRLFWNRQWNEDLFLVSLAERMLNPASNTALAHSQREWRMRIARHLIRNGAPPGAMVHIRLRLVSRVGGNLVHHTVFHAGPCVLDDLAS